VTAEVIDFLPLGDSYTIGISVRQADRWPDQLVEVLAGRVPLRVVANPARNGLTSRDLIDDELPLVARLKPGLVSVLIGVNDVVQGVSADRYRGNVALIVDTLLEAPGQGQVRGVGVRQIADDLFVRHVAHRTAVMYLGEVVETAPTKQLWDAPLHPYTRALIEAIPHPDGAGHLPAALAGEIPDPVHPPTGCRFHPRCPFAFEPCPAHAPVLVAMTHERRVACWLHEAALSSPRSGPPSG